MYCLGCAITHLIPYCPKNPNRIYNATKSAVGVVTLPSSSETENVAPIQAITRAQTLKAAKELRMEERNHAAPTMFQPVKGRYSMDERTLRFIANGGVGSSQPIYNHKEMPKATKSEVKCHKCGGNHLMKDCPHTEIVRINTYCLGCAITHLIPDCPKNPNRIDKATKSVVGVVTLPSSSENDNVASV